VSWRLVASVTAGWRLAPMTCSDRTVILKWTGPWWTPESSTPRYHQHSGDSGGRSLRPAVRRASERCCGCSVADAPGCSGQRSSSRCAPTARASARIPAPPEPPDPRATLVRCDPRASSDHCPSQAPPCRILWETWLIGHGGIAHPRTILEGAQIWNHSRLGPSIEGVSPCESS
jgi:hypothetical protein